MPKVSVIIPVYNVAAYLRAGMDSLLAQSERDWSAICVDDGSTDGSGVILDEYAAKDRRIGVVHQANAGVSAARNAGLERATGEIVAFMDADDVATPDWLARLVAGIDGVDLVWGGGWIEKPDGTSCLCAPDDVGAVYTDEAVRRRIWRAVFAYRLRDLVWLPFPGGPWRHARRELGGLYWRAVRRSVIGDLRFDTDLSLYEDALFLSAVAQRARTMRVIGDTGYRYFIRETGSMLRETHERMTAHKFRLRDARRALDPKMTHWRGTFLLSALQVLALTHSASQTLRYLRGGDLKPISAPKCGKIEINDDV